MEIHLWEYNAALKAEETGPPALICPETIKSQASRATVNLPRLREFDVDDDDDGSDAEEEIPEKIWVTIGLSRVCRIMISL